MFECKPTDDYVRNGYVVREALDSVHNAIDRNKIENVYLDYVKFVVQFLRIVVGMLARLLPNEENVCACSVLSQLNHLSHESAF